jgi:hypothetical protein
MANGRFVLSVLIALCWAFAAGAQPTMYRLMGKRAAVNNYVFVDTASARPATTNATVVATPARNYTAANFIVVQTVDYPFARNLQATLTDNKGNTYVNVFSDTVNFQRVRHWKCYNPDFTGGSVVLTYASVGGIVNLPTIYAAAFRDVVSDPGWLTNSSKTTLSVPSIGTGNVTTTVTNALLVTTFASATNITAAPTISGSFSVSDRINWYPAATLRNQYSGSYWRAVTSTGVYNATHTSGGANLANETIGTIVAYQ